jgi:hypothetical protein
MANIYDMVDEWDDGVTTFTSIKMNVTDTASAAASLLMDLQVGGSSKFKVEKDGDVTLGAPASFVAITNGSRSINLSAGGVTSGGIRHISGSSLTFLAGSGYGPTSVANGLLNGGAGSFIGWQAGPYSFSSLTPDLALYRDAANTLAQRNSTNAQTFNLYNTYTDASNYERGFMKWNSNVLEIGTQGAGTGSNFRSLLFKRGATTLLELNSAQVRIGGNLTWTQGSVANIIFPEDTVAPAGIANNAIIFAEDDGAGKTRLMVQFGTGAAQQIAIEP